MLKSKNLAGRTEDGEREDERGMARMRVRTDGFDQSTHLTRTTKPCKVVEPVGSYQVLYSNLKSAEIFGKKKKELTGTRNPNNRLEYGMQLVFRRTC